MGNPADIYDVSIVIVNYNGKKYIDQLFDSICQLYTVGLCFEVVFVDNSSTDDSISYLHKKGYEKKINLKIVTSKQNLGFAGGNNLGVKYADGEYIVFLNNDTKVDKMWLFNLWNYMKTNECGIVNSKLIFFYDFIKISFYTIDKILLSNQIKINGREYTIENKYCKNVLYGNTITCFDNSEILLPVFAENDSTIQFEIIDAPSDVNQAICESMTWNINSSGEQSITIPSEIIQKNKSSVIQNAGSGINKGCNGYDRGFCEVDNGQYDKECELDCACGAAMMLKRDDFIRCGMFDEKFFMYYEDVDLSYQIKKMGKRILYCPGAVVRHIHTGSSVEWSNFFIYQVYRNKLLFVAKNISKIKFYVFFAQQIAEGIWQKNKIKIRASYDALCILRGKQKAGLEKPE